MGTLDGRLGPPVLFVADLERSRAFYVDEVGFTLAHRDDTSIALTIGDDMVLLVHVDSAEEMLAASVGSPRGRAAMFELNLFVDDVDATCAAMAARGVDFLIEPVDRPWGRRTAHLRDPDGFVWEVSQALG